MYVCIILHYLHKINSLLKKIKKNSNIKINIFFIIMCFIYLLIILLSDKLYKIKK